MAVKKTVNMTISVFEIKPASEGIQEFNLPVKLDKALNETKSAKERLMPLGNDEINKDSDCISNFNMNQSYLFGSFVRLNAGEESVVKLSSLDKMKVDINEMISEAAEDSAGSIYDTVFFCAYENLFVLNSAKKNRRAIETYINWLLREKTQDDQSCILTPMKNTASTVPIKDIQSIQFSNNYLSSRQDIKNESMKLSWNLLRNLFNDVKSAKDFELEDVISATLFLKINKKQLKKNNAAALDTALRLVDSDDITVLDKKGKKIKGTEYFVKTVRSFEKPDAAYYNVKAIETEMRNIIKAVKNGEVVT